MCAVQDQYDFDFNWVSPPGKVINLIILQVLYFSCMLMKRSVVYPRSDTNKDIVILSFGDTLNLTQNGSSIRDLRIEVMRELLYIYLLMNWEPPHFFDCEPCLTSPVRVV